jgi:hypothetical protein
LNERSAARLTRREVLLAHITAAYVGDACGPGNIQNHFSEIRESGLTTAILNFLHVGKLDQKPGMKWGDLFYNEELVVSGDDSRFNPNNSPAIRAWPARVAHLKRECGVSKVFISIGGGPPVQDFATIHTMFADGRFPALTASIAALRSAFMVNGVCTIDGFDIDCEELESQKSKDGLRHYPKDIIVEFCKMLFHQGFAVTFCPYMMESDWMSCMKTLWDQHMKVSWWNLQCFEGGHDNVLSPWIEALEQVVGKHAPSFLVPGLAVKSADDVRRSDDRLCPDEFKSKFSGWKNLGLAGGFLWNYPALVNKSTECSGQNNLANYVKAINGGLGGV